MGRKFTSRQVLTRRLRCEPLEDRRMLSVLGSDAIGTGGAISNEAIEMFHTQDALFAENAGQWATDNVYFGYNKGGTQIYFTDDGLDFGLSRTGRPGLGPAVATPIIDAGLQAGLRDEPEIESTHFSLHFDGAQPTIPTGADPAQTKFNYHLGAQEDWTDAVATYKTVIYNDLYEGIDLHTFSRHGQMKYEFHVSPGVDYTQIELSYDGIEGLSIATDGSLHIGTELGDIIDEDLYIYQLINSQEIEVAGQFTLLDDDSYAFTVTGEYDPTVKLVIDPNIEWGSYLGGSQASYANDVTTDVQGNVYVCGETYSSGWGISGGWDTTYANLTDGYVVKLSSTGSHLWSTYLGGLDYDWAKGVTTDAQDNVYVCGGTQSSIWGISGGWDTMRDWGCDGYVVKLSSAGAHLWSTYLGGSHWDTALDVTTDAQGNVYVCGDTNSSNWELSGGWDTEYSGGDGFLVKLSDDGSHIWSTYLGGSDYYDTAHDVSTDAQGNVLVCGSTVSNDWGVSGGWDITLDGESDGYVVKISSDGTYLWSTFLGGSSYDYARGVSTDAQGNVFVCGYTKSIDWVLFGGWNTTFGDGVYSDYVVKLSSTGTHLWSSYLGGADADYTSSVSTDSRGNVYVCGGTSSSNWGVSGGWDTMLDGYSDGYVAKLSSDGAHLWSTYLGGLGGDQAYAVATGAQGNVYICGRTYSSSWGISGGWDAENSGSPDGYVLKINDGLPVAILSNPIVAARDTTIEVTYPSNIAISVATIGTGDIIVTGPNGYSQYATLVSVDNNIDGSPLAATYCVTSPNNRWRKGDNGTYQISMVADQVSDTSGNFVPAGLLGTFDVMVTTDDTVTILEDDIAVTIDGSDLTANDGGDQPLTIISVATTLDTHGEVLLTDQTVTYTPDVGFDGSAAFEYTVVDQQGNQSTATVTVAYPQTITVDSIEDNVYLDGFITLREATEAARLNIPIGDAPAGQIGQDRIDFDPSLYAEGTAWIVLGGFSLGITDDLELLGPGADQLAIDANGRSSVMQVTENVAAAIDGLTITGGLNNLGGGIVNNGMLSVTNSTIYGNSANFGGGIFHDGTQGTATLTVSDSTFMQNTVTDNGGGIAINCGDVTVSNSGFYNNSAQLGAGIHIEGVLATGTLTITDSEFLGNSATDNGGGIFNNSATLAISDSTMFENSANNHGGGIINFYGNTTVSSSSFWNNTATNGGGGGLCNSSGTMAVSTTELWGNSAGYGGAVMNDGFQDPTILTVSDSTLAQNLAADNGGAIANYSGEATIINSEISRNIVGQNGGGILNFSGMMSISNSGFFDNSAGFGAGILNDGVNGPASLAITDSMFWGNIASDSGGGLYNADGEMIVSNSTVSRNLAFNGGGFYNYGNSGSAMLKIVNSMVSYNSAVYGGGILNDGYNGSATLIANNSTITGNQAHSKGGGILTNCISSNVTLHNTIVAINISILDADITCQDNAVILGTHNLIGDGSGQTSLIHGTDGNIIGTAENPIDPQFVRAPSDGGDGWGDDIDTPGIDESANDDYGDLWLTSDSPAIDAGSDALAVDADGNTLIIDLGDRPRIRFDHVDMGAFEYTPVVDVFAVIVTEPNTLDTNGEYASLPSESNWIDEWQPFYVEIWVDASATDDMGVTSAYVNLKYNTDYHTATAIEYGAGFEMSREGTIDDVTGTVAGLGAGTSRTDIGDDGHALLARVRFEPTPNDAGVPFEIDGTYMPEVNNEIGLEIMQYGLSGTDTCETRLTHLPATRLVAVPYDLDNDGVIGLGDLAHFASVYQEQPGVSTDSPYAWAADFDRSGTVDLGDLAFFASNYQLSRPNDTIAYPPEFSQLGSGIGNLGTETPQLASATGTQAEDSAILAANWQKSGGDTWIDGDFNGDGQMDDIDATLLAANWQLNTEDDEDDARQAVFADVGASGDLMGLLD